MIPEELKTIAGLEHWPYELATTKYAVYFLYNKGVLVYIGRAKNVYARAFCHIQRKSKEFDAVYYLHVANFLEASLLERYFIQTHKPPYNSKNVFKLNKQMDKVLKKYEKQIVNS